MTETRVALLLPGLYGGGAEQVMLHVARGLLSRGAAVDIVLFKKTGELLDQVPPGARLVDLGAGRARYAVRLLIEYLQRDQPATLFAALTHANLVAVRAGLRSSTRPRILLSEHSEPVAWLKHGTLRERLAFPPLMRLAYPRADAVVAVSHGVAAGIARLTGIPVENIHVIYNPAIPPDVEQRAAQPVDHPWLKPGGPPVVMGVGRLNRQKHFPALLRAFALLRAERPARLIILGEGPERARLLRLAAELGIADDLDLPGFQPNPFAWIAKASLVALSSEWEGFGLVLVEALACGTPVVSTDCPSGPAEILENGRYGRLVPVNDDPALARAMAETLDTPPPADLLRARAADFRTDRILERYMRLLLPEEHRP